MNYEAILKACIIVGSTGLVIGILLGIAGKFLSVKVDEKLEKVRDALPGNNCGGCGFPGCDGLAAAICAGEAPASGCPVGGEAVAKAIGKIMGQEVTVVKKVAYVKCSGTCDKTSEKFEYHGNMTCADAALVAGGKKSCSHGCLGYGSCVAVCDKDAIKIVNGVAVVDRELCAACGKCAKACPRGLIDMIPYVSYYHVACNSKDFGKDVKAVCSAGCIGCKMCTKVCPTDAITVENNIAIIDYDKCCGCGLCAEKCPSKVIELEEGLE